MARHWNWARFRFLGDPVLCQQYMGEGRKYLGELEDQMKYGVISSNTRRVINAAGVVFILSILMGYPIITIDARALANNPPSVAKSMQGFVVRPAGNTNYTSSTEDNFIVLDPKSAWKPYFYQPSDYPASPAFPVGQQKIDSTSRQLFQDGAQHGYSSPHLDGLQYGGNVDWRNANESLILTWFGPLTRYLEDQGTFTSRVFFHGQVLFDCAPLTAAGFFGDTSAYSADYGGNDGIITGACIANDPNVGTVLLAVVRFGSAGDGFWPQKEYLLRLRLKTTDARGVGGPSAAIWSLVPATATTLAGDPVVIGSNDIATDVYDAKHPWFFNSTGTEARCIRYRTDMSGVYVESLECVLSSDGGFSENAQAYPTATLTSNTSATTYTGAVLSGSVSGASVWSGATPPPSGTPIISLLSGTFYASPVLSTVFGHTPIIDSPTYMGFGTDASYTEVMAPSVSQALIAVDYRDDIPVYAYGLPPSWHGTGSQSGSVSGSYSDAPSVSETTWGAPVSFTDTISITTHCDTTLSYSLTGVNGGLRTDWMTVNATNSRTTSLTASNETITTISGSATSVMSGGPIPTYGGLNWSTLTSVKTISAPADLSDAQESDTLYLWYLDLRFKWLVYSLAKTSSSSVSTAGVSGSVTIDHVTGAGSTSGDLTYSSSTGAHTATPIISASKSSTDYYVTKDGETITHTTTIESLTSDTTYYDMQNDELVNYNESDVRFSIYAHGGGAITADVLQGNGDTFLFGWVGFSVPAPLSFAGRPGASYAALPSYVFDPASVAASSSSTPVTLGHWIVNPITNLSTPALNWMYHQDHVAVSVRGYWYGSWQNYKSDWLVSQSLPSGTHSTPNYFNANSGNADMFARTNTTAPTTQRFFPCWTLPAVTA